MLTKAGNIGFWSKVHIEGPTDCWEWGCGVDKSGYGRYFINSKKIPAHRYI